MELVRIIIPAYKELSYHEEISLRQCFKVLNKYPVTLVCPPNLNVQQYINISKDCHKQISVERFKKEFFQGLEGYNKLMMSLEFYLRFKKSKFLLIHQTDAFVFKDELTDWCRNNYDYIGAPWPFDVSGWLDAGYPKEIMRYYKLFGRKNVPKAGNGGFSLRKTRSFINNLYIFQRSVRRWKFNEDMFFSHYINTLNPFFKVPHLDVSKHFAFDTNPAQFLQLNENKLPFGCHGWYRNDADYAGNLNFWKKFIELYGYDID